MAHLQPQRSDSEDEEHNAIQLTQQSDRSEDNLVDRRASAEPRESFPPSVRKKLYAGAALIMVVLIIIITWLASRGRGGGPRPPYPNAREERVADPSELMQCIHEQGAKYNPKFPGHGRSPSTGGRTSKKGNFWIRNATVWVGEGHVLEGADVVIKDGVIAVVGTAQQAQAAVASITLEGQIDANRAVLTPGIVDMHSHIGVYAFPQIWATSDGNEMTNPTFPQVRAIDAFDPEDWAIPQLLAMGVTTSQVLPGSGNLMGGEGGIFKLRGNRVVDMFVEDSPRLLKFACGENPKRVYGRRHQTPMSRMGNAWLFRKKLDEARTLKEAQEHWCNNYVTQSPLPQPTYPHDLSLESLVALLRGEAKLHNHCYQVQDLEMMIRLSKEFGFKVSAFHHALEAYKIPDIIRANNITIATFSDLWGYKYEAYDASVRSPKILADAGVPVALKSDHPVLFAATLMWEATKAHYYGLEKDDAIAALTSVPAAAVGMDAHVGQIRVGLDGDMVLWDRYPFTVGAVANKVLVNGVLEVDRGRPLEPPVMPAEPAPVITLEGMICPSEATIDEGEWAVTGVTIYPMSPSKTTTISNGIIVVKNGNITCMGAAGACPGSPGTRRTVNVPGGFVMPGLIDAGSGIGQLEIDAESSTQDGSIEGSSPTGSASVHAMDGIRIYSRHVRAAWSGAVTTSIARPQGTQVVAGESVAFHTCHFAGCGASIHDHMIQRTVALHLNVGNNAKDTGLSASISGELDELRETFGEAQSLMNASSVSFNMQPFVAALKQEIPVVAEVYQTDIIASVARLQAEFGFRLVILGGVEAHVVRDMLAAATPPIGVIQWARMPPKSDFDSLRAVDNSLKLLNDVGVPVGLFVGDPDNGRNLRWEAGWANAYGLDYSDALAAVTTNVADMLMIKDPHVSRIITGNRANFVVYDGDPLTTAGRPQVVAVRTAIHCQPQQF